MRAAAQFNGKRAIGALAGNGTTHRNDAHLVAILFAEKRARARLDGFVNRHQPRHNGLVLQRHAVGDILDARELLLADRLGMREVETQPVACDKRSLLRDVIAQHDAQSLMQQMRRRMIGANRLSTFRIDRQLHRHAGAQLAFRNLDVMHEKIAELLLRVANMGAHARGGEKTRVADLTARLCVKRRLVDDHKTALALRQAIGFRAFAHDGRDDALGLLGFITQKLRRADAILDGVPDCLGRSFARPGPRLARLGALTLHGLRERSRIDADAAGAQRVLRQIERKPYVS